MSFIHDDAFECAERGPPVKMPAVAAIDDPADAAANARFHAATPGRDGAGRVDPARLFAWLAN